MSTAARRCRGATSALGHLEAVACRPEIALLVSTYQKPWHLERVLTSIAMQKGVENRMQVVVTDDGSTDRTPDIVRRFARSVPFRASFTTHPHKAFQLARCRNEGVAATTAPYLLFLDGDCVLPPDHVLKHLKHRRPDYAMGGYCCRLDEQTSARFDDEAIRSGKYLDWAPRSQRFELAKRAVEARFYQLIRHPTKPKLPGGNIGVWREDYQRVNGYDENFQGWGCEDDDLRFRLRRSGVKTACILRWTWTYHLWHPPDASAPERIGQGVNVAYLNRPFRLTRCMNGLLKRSIRDVAFRLVGTPSRPAAAGALLKSHGINADVTSPERSAHGTGAAEVELLFLPGKGRFSGRADCSILVVLEHSPRAARLARKAHVVVAGRPYPGVPAGCSFQLTEFDRALGALA